MKSKLQHLTADHRRLLDLAAQQAGLCNPIAVSLGDLQVSLLKKARKGELLPIDGVMIRDWSKANRKLQPGVVLGMRLYHVQGMRLVRVRMSDGQGIGMGAFDFFVVDRRDYRPLYRIALKARRELEPSPSRQPVLARGLAEVLWQNTIGYLEPGNLRRIKRYGGRAKRGILLMGPPGNGKTMACRWLWEECRRRGWEWRLVTPDSYRQARARNAVGPLFSVNRRGIIFFDDMDLALRDRETVRETEDQAVFLTALDGIVPHEGVVFVFTSNCAPELIDRAFKRPGRLDVVLHFKPPEDALRRELILSWHEDVRAGIDEDAAVESTEGFTFAEIEELKNLLILGHTDSGEWDWDWALAQFEANRRELANKKRRRRVGFGPAELAPNGAGNGQ